MEGNTITENNYRTEQNRTEQNRLEQNRIESCTEPHDYCQSNDMSLTFIYMSVKQDILHLALSIALTFSSFVLHKKPLLPNGNNLKCHS